MLNSNVRQDNQSQEQIPNFQHHYYVFTEPYRKDLRL